MVQSSHGPNINYRVFYGTVNWGRTAEGMQPAFVVFMQYGNKESWEEAKSAGEIDFKMLAHILNEDLSKVLQAISELS